ncbi:MAG TPA: hypothetical protein VF173_32925 [Thermoanaerobaculia bacterium]|nr:hypothetical protein [Thermoanaerobaculia bacterium]
MNPDLSHLRVTVVDLMGVFLPGVIWTILIATLQESVSQSSAGVSPISVAQEFLAPGRGVGFYIVSSVLALIVGYVAKTIAIPPSERLARLLDGRVARLFHRPGRPLKAPSAERLQAGDETAWTKALRLGYENLASSDYQFPYHAIHSAAQNVHYYGKILELVEARLGLKWNWIPRSQLFASCKRMLKLHAAPLWEDAEYREAEVRMLASLFLAALFSLMLTAVQYVFGGVFNSNWAVASLAATVLLCFAFRARRCREVESVYFAFLSALPLIPITMEEAGEASGTGVTQRSSEDQGRSHTGLKRTDTAL